MDMKFERDTAIDNMAETLFNSMVECADDGRNFDAISIYEEWVIDGVDPQDEDYEFTFMNNLTLEHG